MPVGQAFYSDGGLNLWGGAVSVGYNEYEFYDMMI